MHLVATLRFLLKLVRTGLHAAVVVTASLSLFLLFLLWSVLQFFEEPAATSAALEDAPKYSSALIDRQAR